MLSNENIAKNVTNDIKTTDIMRIFKKSGDPLKNDNLIPGTTFMYDKPYGKVLESICILEQYKIIHDGSTYCLNNNDDYIYVHKVKDGQINLFTTNPYSNDVFTILFLLGSELNCSKSINAIVRKLYTHASDIGFDNLWDSFSKDDALELCTLYTEFVEKLIEDKQFFIIKNHDLFKNSFCFNNEMLSPNKDGHLFEKIEELNIQRLSYTKEELDTMPSYLVESINDNIAFYESYKDSVDGNIIQIIKAFKSDNIWSAGYYGPSGTGKTTAAKIIAGALGLPIVKVTGSRNVDEPYLFGKYILKNGQTEFSYGPLSIAMQYGALFLFDEINMIEGDVLSSLNDVLEVKNGQKILENGEQISCHNHFKFIETMNIGYAGTNDVNISHKSRIQLKVKVSKLSMDQYIFIVTKNANVDRIVARRLVSFIDDINDLIYESGNEYAQRIDVRNIINWANLSVALDYDYVQASIPTVVAGLLEEDITISNSELEDIILSDTIASKVMSLIIEKLK